MVLGPRDKRGIRKRCVSCARRRIKCEGSPCTYCTKKGIDCTPQTANNQQGLIILNQTPAEAPQNPLAVSQHQSPSFNFNRIYLNDRSTEFINHFFNNFISSNYFGAEIDLSAIISEFQCSPSLHHAATAIGAFDLSAKTSSSRSIENVTALRHYQASVLNFQSEIEKQGFLESSNGLWTTFFLGLYELMYDVSGEGWIRHILYGTSKILQLRGPGVLQSERGRSFFLTAQVFEICRSIIYSEPTFLQEDAWKIAVSGMWEGTLIEVWHPKDSLFDLMLECSALSQRVWNTVDPKIEQTKQIQIDLIESASVGLQLRMSLDSWYVHFQNWKGDHSAEADTRSTLATIYFHAISIYLSGIFDYRYQYNEITSPVLSVEMIQAHVHSILSETENALSTTNLAGLLFLFPLRVAGARIISLGQAKSIVFMFNEISKKNFVVAEAFVMDLENVWETRKQITHFQ